MIRRISLALVAATVAAFILSLSGCGSQMTLETYFQENSDLWNQVVSEVEDAAGEMFDLEMTVSGNEIKQVMTYTETFDDDAVEAMREYFNAQEGALRTEISQSVKQLQVPAEIDEITWVMTYNNGDGSEIYSLTLDSSTLTAPAIEAGASDQAEPATPEADATNVEAGEDTSENA